eukprot:TRINITY_DN23787_c0_g1_i1.p1 TRINITY_DN23787_c0_g1~~TRINITY_DN23787_c0_g1_i1.p1  ORF type:complete len:457 (+),score=91.62 TRINITY_DN23787_c0_g1_i1:45-1373(+)
MAQSLQNGLRAKRAEADALSAELARAKFEEQRLRLRLTSFGRENASLIPSELRAGAGSAGRSSLDLAAGECKSLLEWLAASVDTSRGTAFNAPGGVQISEREVHLGHMVQWHLRGVAGGLKLSVPRDRESEILALLGKARGEKLSQTELWQVGEEWEMLGADVACEHENQPAIFLVHRASAQALVVAAWPSLPAPLPAPVAQAPEAVPGFDVSSFLGLDASPSTITSTIKKIAFIDTDGDVNTLTPLDQSGTLSSGLSWGIAGHSSRRVETVGVYFDTADRCTLSGPFGRVTLMDPGPGDLQRDLIAHLIVMAQEQDVPVHTDQILVDDVSQCSHAATSSDAKPLQSSFNSSCDSSTSSSSRLALPVANPFLFGVSTGDSVEVAYAGRWFSGVLQGVEGEVAQVKCDVDAPSVITLAHLSNVRLAVPKVQRTHMRSRSKPCP